MSDARVAVITGATSGLGRAAAHALHRRGVRIVAAGRDRERGESLVEELGGASAGEAIFVATDVASADSVTALVHAALDTFGRLDMAVNSAASTAGAGSPTADTEEAAFDEQIAVTLKGTWLCMREQLRAMMASGGGSIVNVSSINGLSGTRGASAYSAAKHGVIGLTRSAALEYGPAGMRINAVCPGPFDTPMLQGVIELAGGPAFADAYKAQIPAGRFGTPDEAGELIAWLAAEAPAYMSGSCLVVDGAMTA